MGRSNRFADMYEAYAHTETARKEQPAIRLRHMGCGPNDCRRQPRLQFAVAKGKLKLKPGNTKRINFEHWRIDVKPRLPKYPTCIVTTGMDPDTLLRSAERTKISTMRKLMPLGGWTGSNSIFQNSQWCYNLQNFGIGRWLWKSFLRSTEWVIHNESLWWHSHSGE
jgi:hypothetical protein